MICLRDPKQQKRHLPLQNTASIKFNVKVKVKVSELSYTIEWNDVWSLCSQYIYRNVLYCMMLFLNHFFNPFFQSCCLTPATKYSLNESILVLSGLAQQSRNKDEQHNVALKVQKIYSLLSETGTNESSRSNAGVSNSFEVEAGTDQVLHGGGRTNKKTLLIWSKMSSLCTKQL